MLWSDRILEAALTIVLIIGGYQFYFWAQRQTFYEARYLTTRFDSWITFDPRWVWVYSGLYYPMIILAAFSLQSWPEFAYRVGGFLTLLAVQMFFFLRFPVAIPPDWRNNYTVYIQKQNHPRSARFLDLVWSYDKLRNSMPSMHVSVATTVDLTIGQHWPVAGYLGGLFPLLIAISALKTKQHYVVDVVPGALLGAAVFWTYNVLVMPV